MTTEPRARFRHEPEQFTDEDAQRMADEAARWAAIVASATRKARP